MRPVLRVGWTRWCAAVLLALLALSLLHAAAHHGATQRDCSTCKALNSPGVAQVPGTFGCPAEKPSALAAPAESGPLAAAVRFLRPLRAPPGSPVL